MDNVERDQWREVIATICRDGGHYHQANGTDKTKEYCIKTVLYERYLIERLTRTLRELYKYAHPHALMSTGLKPKRICKEACDLLEEITGNVLSYEEWLDQNDEELSIADAESGRDRELDYDSEALREQQYQQYLDKTGRHVKRQVEKGEFYGEEV